MDRSQEHRRRPLKRQSQEAGAAASGSGASAAPQTGELPLVLAECTIPGLPFSAVRTPHALVPPSLALALRYAPLSSTHTAAFIFLSFFWPFAFAVLTGFAFVLEGVLHCLSISILSLYPRAEHSIFFKDPARLRRRRPRYPPVLRHPPPPLCLATPLAHL